MQIRRASLSDLEPLTGLFDGYRQFYDKASDVDAARAFLADRFTAGDSVILIAEQDATALGFTQLYPAYSSLAMRRIFILNDLFVTSEARRVGVASALLHAAAEYGKNAGAARLVLSTAHTNTAARRLYESLGWQRDTEFLVYELAL